MEVPMSLQISVEAREQIQAIVERISNISYDKNVISIEPLLARILFLALRNNALDEFESTSEIDMYVGSGEGADFSFSLYKDGNRFLYGGINCNESWFNIYAKGKTTLKEALEEAGIDTRRPIEDYKLSWSSNT